MANNTGTVYTCKKCQRVFDRKSNLNRHLRIHQTKVKNFVCAVCSKTFANKANLKAYFYNTHNGMAMPAPKLALVQNKGSYFTKNFILSSVSVNLTDELTQF